jgi:hypothetical protein
VLNTNQSLILVIDLSEAVLKAFDSSKLDDQKSSRRKLTKQRQTETKSFFAKYLTSEKVSSKSCTEIFLVVFSTLYLANRSPILMIDNIE